MTVAVVDASVVIAALINAGNTGRWAEGQMSDVELTAPHLMWVEVSNILRRRVLAGAVTREEATLAHSDLLDLNVEALPFAPFGGRVWELRDNLSAYDAWYVAAAEALQCRLVTLDARLAAAPGVACDIRLPPSDEKRRR